MVVVLIHRCLPVYNLNFLLLAKEDVVIGLGYVAVLNFSLRHKSTRFSPLLADILYENHKTSHVIKRPHVSEIKRIFWTHPKGMRRRRRRRPNSRVSPINVNKK